MHRLQSNMLLKKHESTEPVLNEMDVTMPQSCVYVMMTSS